MPRLFARDIDLAETLARTGGNGFDFLVVEGVVLKETRLSNRAALELLVPGDMLGPPVNAIRQSESRAVSRYLAHGPVTLAELGARFRQAARRWPGLSDVLLDRLARQTDRASGGTWPCCTCRVSRIASLRCSATSPSASDR